MREPTLSHLSNRALLWPYVLPYLVYTGIASVPERWLSTEASYALRLIGTGAALAWAWSRYAPLSGPRPRGGSIGVGIGSGLLGAVGWIALVAPFAPSDASPMSFLGLGLRLVATTLLIPLTEELLMRGYVLRLVVQWDRARAAGATDAFDLAFDRSSVNRVEPGAWTPAAVAVSTLLFTFGHWPAFQWGAALFYGLLMALLWVRRRDLLSCVFAHATTNLCLGIYVVLTGSWAIW